MIEYEKMSFHAEDVAVIRCYASTRGLTFVDAMHGIARILEHIMRENRHLRTSDFSSPEELPVKVPPAVRFDGHVCVARQRNLFSTERLTFKKLSHCSAN